MLGWTGVAHRDPHPRRIHVKLRTTSLSIPAGPVWLDGQLAHAPNVRGLALLLLPRSPAAGDTREAFVADHLQSEGFATLALDLLTRHEEARDPDLRFNVPLLANRLLSAIDWIGHQPPLAALEIGVIASGTACGAAVRAGWKAPDRLAAIVCRGGRPDLAGAMPLASQAVPIRFVVGARDPERPIVARAFEHLRAPRDWQEVEGADALFLEPGTLARFARLAGEWLLARLRPPAAGPDSPPATQALAAPRDA